LPSSPHLKDYLILILIQVYPKLIFKFCQAKNPSLANHFKIRNIESDAVRFHSFAVTAASPSNDENGHKSKVKVMVTKPVSFKVQRLRELLDPKTITE
jgi:hypothetical protein